MLYVHCNLVYSYLYTYITIYVRRLNVIMDIPTVEVGMSYTGFCKVVVANIIQLTTHLRPCFMVLATKKFRVE